MTSPAEQSPVPLPAAAGLTGGTARRMLVAVLARPDLWWTALGVFRRLAVPGWWREPPYLPVPDRRLWEFRMVTAYGRPDAEPVADDVMSYLEWCRSTAGRLRRVPHRPMGDERASTLLGRQSG
jgi:hypothetical protein